MSLNNAFLEPIEKHSNEIFQFLSQLVNINSFTQNISGIEKVANVIIEKSKKFGFIFEKYFPEKDSERFHLICNQNFNDNFYGIIGHFDTVHPPESSFQSLKEQDDKLIGPGVNDMKGGIVVALYSLFLLKILGITPNVKIIFNSDEEIGSKTSKKFIMEHMKGADGVFVFEAGRLPGNKIISSRKGVIELIVEVFGKHSHAGENASEGINAIVELADKIIKLYELTGSLEGLTVHPGIINGGIARNVVPDYAKAVVDIRFNKSEDKKVVFEKIEKILKLHYINNTKSTLKVQIATPT